MTPRPAGDRRVAATSEPDRRVPKLLLAAVLVLSAASWVSYQLYTSTRLEDALITFRYAENLARGEGFVFNPGEPVLGTTSPFFGLVLAAFAVVFGTASIPLISNALGIAAAVGTGIFVFAALRRAGGSAVAALLAVATLGAHPDTLSFTTSGLETPLVIFFMALGLYGAAAERWTLAAVATALLVWTRIDGLIWAAIIFAAATLSLGRAVWRPALVGAAVLLPWFVFALVAFGSVIPHSIAAKREIHPTGSPRYIEWLLNSLWLSMPRKLLPAQFGVWSVLVVTGAVEVIVSARKRVLMPLVLFPVSFAVALGFGKAPYFPWYMVPVTWCAGILGVLGSVGVAKAVAWLLGRWGRWGYAGALISLWSWLGVAVIRRDVAQARSEKLTQENEDGLRKRVGVWLSEHTPPRAVIAMEAIGYQGATSRRRIVDLAGLISPEVVAIHRSSGSNAEAFDRVLRTTRPDAVVLRSYEFDRNAHAHGGPLFATQAQADSFSVHYQEAERFAAPHPEAWGENGHLTVFLRRSPGS